MLSYPELYILGRRQTACMLSTCMDQSKPIYFSIIQLLVMKEII